MNRAQERQLKKLEEKIEIAKRNGNYVQHLALLKEREKLFEAKRVEVRQSLKDAMQDYTSDKRREMTKNIIVAVVMSDIMVSATMDIEECFRKYGMSSVPMLSDIRNTCNKFKDVVATINNVHNDLFTERYMEVADEVEEKVMKTLKEYITESVMKIDLVKK